jgi:hypothetical protein
LGIPVYFHRIVRSDSGLFRLQNFAPDRSEFDESSVIDWSNRASTRIYRRRTNGDLSVVKSVSFSPLIEGCQIETEIQNLFNMRHPLIGSVVPIGVPQGSHFSLLLMSKTILVRHFSLDRSQEFSIIQDQILQCLGSEEGLDNGKFLDIVMT